MMKTITPAQCRGARGMLDWSAKTLAKKAGVSLPTITRFESGRRPQPLTLKAILEAFECGGARFVDDVGITVPHKEKETADA
jgi:predicted transcriptional regulator